MSADNQRAMSAVDEVDAYGHSSVSLFFFSLTGDASVSAKGRKEATERMRSKMAAIVKLGSIAFYNERRRARRVDSLGSKVFSGINDKLVETLVFA
jgi:hypothetical protein